MYCKKKEKDDSRFLEWHTMLILCRDGPLNLTLVTASTVLVDARVSTQAHTPWPLPVGIDDTLSTRGMGGSR